MNRLRKVWNGGVDKFRHGGQYLRNAVGRVPGAGFVNRHRAAIAFLALAVYSNARAVHIQDSQAIDIGTTLARYPHFPSWMHTDPVQVLGLPAQVAPTFVPSRDTIWRAWKGFSSKWHPDKQITNGFSDTDAKAVYDRGLAARTALLRWHRDPYCYDYWRGLVDFDVDTAYANQSIPHFAKDCACTYPKYLTNRIVTYPILKAIWPVDFQAKPPKTIGEACPCDHAIASQSWASFEPEMVPPQLRRIRDQLPWTTPDWRVWIYRMRGLSSGPDFDARSASDIAAHEDPDADVKVDFSDTSRPTNWNAVSKDSSARTQKIAKACANGEYEGCEAMDGWAAVGDFDSEADGCIEDVLKQVGAEGVVVRRASYEDEDEEVNRRRRRRSKTKAKKSIEDEDEDEEDNSDVIEFAWGRHDDDQAL